MYEGDSRSRQGMKYVSLAVCHEFAVGPAMEAGLADHIWTLEELCNLLPALPPPLQCIDKKLLLKALR
jgi:hypothetical protein